MADAIRSYHARRGRLSPSMVEDLARLSPVLDLSAADGPMRLEEVFGREAPRVLEIGSGLGDAVLALAARHPERDFIAADVHTKGIARTLRLAERRGLTNLRVLHGDALEFLRRRCPDASLAEILVLFPDPWPKHRHHKRRLVRPEFTTLAARCLESGGRVHLATDDVRYAAHMRTVLGQADEFRPIHDGGPFGGRPETKYERRGRHLGHPIADLVYQRI